MEDLTSFPVQKMKMVPVSAKVFGNFFEGDCYIVLHVSTILADFNLIDCSNKAHM